MARVVRFHRTGGPKVLQMNTLDTPEPGAGEVRIRVKALGLNRAESMFRLGKYLEEPTFPSRLGYEAAGIVDAVGAAVDGLREGDVVSTIPSFSQGRYGVYGDVAVVPATAVVKHPASLSWEEASAIWMQYLTAYGAARGDRQTHIGRRAAHPGRVEQRGDRSHPDRQPRGSDPHRADPHRRQAADADQVGRSPRHRDRDARPGCGGPAADRRQRWPRVVFDPVGGPTVAKLTGGHGGARHPVPVRGTQPRADPAAPFRRAQQDADDPRVRVVRDHVQRGADWSRANSSSSRGWRRAS